MVVLGDDDKVVTAGKLMDPPTAYGDAYQVIPDDRTWPTPFLVPMELVHPEPPKENDLASPTVTQLIRQAAIQDALGEFQQTIATLRRISLDASQIMNMFLDAWTIKDKDKDD